MAPMIWGIGRNSTKQQSQGLAKENRLKPKNTSMLQYFWLMMSGVWSCLLYVNGQDRQDPDRFPRTLTRTGINSSCHSNNSWVPATSARIWFWNVCVNMPISSSTDHFPGCQSYCQFPVTSSLTWDPVTIYAWQTNYICVTTYTPKV